MPNKNFRQQLEKIIVDHPKSFSQYLHRHAEYSQLIEWINSQTPLLADKFYTLTTKIYWILHDMHDFPKCIHCGNKIQKNVCMKYGYGQYCNVSCQRHSKIRLEHALQTNEKLHGSRNFNNKAKREATNLKKYGAKHNMQSKLGMQEYRNSMQNKYGVDYSWQLSSTIEKAKQTSFERFGVYVTSQSQQVKDKQAATNLKRYGSKSALQNAEVHRKAEQTFLKNHGATHPSWCKDIISKQRKRYTYNGIHFDSKPEIAFYIWLKDNNVKFEYQPLDKAIAYVDLNGKHHMYYPDFYLIETNELIEIKGDQFFNSDGYPKVGKYDWSCKYKCIVDNNVKIYKSKDYVIFINYVNKKYGNNFLQSLKNY